jgi:hypothetical protein
MDFGSYDLYGDKESGQRHYTVCILSVINPIALNRHSINIMDRIYVLLPPALITTVTESSKMSLRDTDL